MHGSLPGLAAGRFGVIMFFSACRLPSFAPEDPPSHASENQITTGMHPSSAICGTPRSRPPQSGTADPENAVLVSAREWCAWRLVVGVSVWLRSQCL